MISGHFPFTRMRRIRQKDFARDLRREHTLSAHDLILPLFVIEGKNKKQAIESMPNVYRYSIDLLLETINEAVKLGIPAVALFPVIDKSKKSLDAKSAWDKKGLIPQAIKAIKKQFPTIGIITDIALDPFTTHGQDGLIDSQGHILNDETIEALIKQALCHAEAGADIVAPSDMMDGRIGCIREALEKNNFPDTMILAYSAKFASSFYGPFRDAVGSKGALGKGNKNTYQIDCANGDEAIQEIALDIDEGADMVMVKPGLPYLDIIRRAREKFSTPIFAYNVSGEYAMVKAASEKNWIEEKKVVLETLLSFKRAGAHAILTYHALDAAKWLK